MKDLPLQNCFSEISFYFDQFKIKFHDSFMNDNVSDKNSEGLFFFFHIIFKKGKNLKN
jgi:hypothetical protein